MTPSPKDTLPPRLDPACTCICHSQPGVMHVAPCCREADPRDAEIARLRTALNDVREETVRLNKATDKQYAQTLEKLKTDRDAALAQVAAAITGNKSGTICRDCRDVGMIHCSDPFNCGGMQPYTVEELKAALSRRDAHMRAEGRKAGLREAAEICNADAERRETQAAELAATGIINETDVIQYARWKAGAIDARLNRDAILAAAEKGNA